MRGELEVDSPFDTPSLALQAPSPPQGGEGTQRTLFAGIGSPHGDDQIGWLVADQLRDVARKGVEIKQASTPSHLLDWLNGVDQLVICDAYLARTDGGQAEKDAVLHRWEWPALQVASLRSAGSHAFGLPQVLELARQLGKLPLTVVVFGVPGTVFDSFAGLSEDLTNRLPLIVKAVAREVSIEQVQTGEEAASHA